MVQLRVSETKSGNFFLGIIRPARIHPRSSAHYSKIQSPSILQHSFTESKEIEGRFGFKNKCN